MGFRTHERVGNYSRSTARTTGSSPCKAVRAYPGHGHFNPGPALGLGYDDLKVLETYHFLQSIAEGRQGEPGLNEALAVAGVLSAGGTLLVVGTVGNGSGNGGRLIEDVRTAD